MLVSVFTPLISEQRICATSFSLNLAFTSRGLVRRDRAGQPCHGDRRRESAEIVPWASLFSGVVCDGLQELLPSSTARRPRCLRRACRRRTRSRRRTWPTGSRQLCGRAVRAPGREPGDRAVVVDGRVRRPVSPPDAWAILSWPLTTPTLSVVLITLRARRVTAPVRSGSPAAAPGVLAVRHDDRLAVGRGAGAARGARARRRERAGDRARTPRALHAVCHGVPGRNECDEQRGDVRQLAHRESSRSA